MPRNAHRTLEQDWKAAAEGGRRRSIEAERQRERRPARGAIVQLQSLADEDLRTAIAAARQAQADWSPTPQLRRDAEQALWLRFRAVCDAIFGRREQVRSAGQAQRQATLDAAAALCAELETLAATPRCRQRRRRPRRGGAHARLPTRRAAARGSTPSNSVMRPPSMPGTSS